MMSALYIDCLSRPNNSPSVVGRGVATHLIVGGDSPINCHYCGNLGHRQKTCVAWIAAQRKGRNQLATRSTPFRRWKGMKRRESKSMWRSFHKSATHSDETCRRQQQQMGVGVPIAPARSRTTTLSSLQAILLPGVILRGKVYRSLQ